MKKKYIRPIVMLIDADIISNVMAGSAGKGSATAQFGGGLVGKEDSNDESMTEAKDVIIGTKGSIFTWSDDDEYND